jgi:large repetitive protein
MMAALVSIDSVTILEGNTGAQNAAITVHVSEPHSNAVSIDYRTADGGATAGSDYTAVSGTLTFAKNELTKTILVPVKGDRAVEFTESFFVNLQNAKGGAKIANSQATVTILDNEPRISIGSVSQLEAQSGVTPFNFTVSLSAAYDQAVTVNYTTADGTAKAGTDYTAATGSLVFAPGEVSKTIPVAVGSNLTAGPDNSFYVNVSTPNSYAMVINGGQAAGTILDREPRISIGDTYLNSGAAFTFTVSLSAAYDHAVTVNYTTVSGTATAGVDYVAQSGTLTFAPGVTTQTITIDVLDQNSMWDKYFSIQLSGVSSNALLANDSAFGYGDGYGYYDYGWYDYYYYDYYYYGWY